jgi:outer membrane receptor protein involved in Fe transport
VWFCAAVIAFTSAAAYALDDGSSSAAAEDALFEDIPMVVSSGFFKTKATKAPGNTVLITHEQIVDSPARTMDDLIEYYVPGMIVAEHEFSGSILASRGVGVDNNAKTLLLYDGQNINQRAHLGSEAEYRVPLLGDIDSMEVANGPNAIVHGSGAINGYVNMIPKTGTKFPGWMSNTEYGPVEKLYKQEAGYGHVFGEGRDLYMYFGLVDAHGVKVKQDTWDNDFAALDLGRRGSVNHGLLTQGYAKPTYKATMNANFDDFRLKTYFEDYNSYYNGVQPNSANSTTYEPVRDSDQPFMNVSKLSIGPEYTVKISDDTSIDFIGLMQAMQHFYDDVKQVTWPTQNEGVRQGGTEKHAELKSIFKTTAFDKHSFALGGLAGRREFRDRDSYLHGGVDYEREEHQTMHWREYAVFAEDVYQLTDLWTVSGGIRNDATRNSPFVGGYRDEFDAPDYNSTTRRLATAYEWTKQLSTKLSYQEGFRAPDAAYYTRHAKFSQALMNNGGHDPLTPLKPEEMKSTEFNTHLDIPSLRTSHDLNVYYNEYENTLFWHNYQNVAYPRTSVEVDDVVNATHGGTPQYWMGAADNASGKFRSHGFELKNVYDATDNLKLTGIYGYSRPSAVNDETAATQMQAFLMTENKNSWVLFPTHMVKLAARYYMLKKKLVTAGAWVYNSGRSLSKASDSSLSQVYGNHFSRVDVSAQYKFTESFSIKLVVKNLLEESTPRMTFSGNPYQGAAGQERRYFYLSMLYEF